MIVTLLYTENLKCFCENALAKFKMMITQTSQRISSFGGGAGFEDYVAYGFNRALAELNMIDYTKKYRGGPVGRFPWVGQNKE